MWSPQGFSVHTCEHACCETLAKTHRMKSKSFTLRAAGHRPHPARDLHLRAHTQLFCRFPGDRRAQGMLLFISSSSASKQLCLDHGSQAHSTAL